MKKSNISPRAIKIYQYCPKCKNKIKIKNREFEPHLQALVCENDQWYNYFLNF